MKNANFIAIDFETATPQRVACQIGIAVVKEGSIIKRISKLIQPPKNKYSNHCIKVHGITPDMTANSPTFDIVWSEIKEYFEGNFVIAHNAAFDIDVLHKSLDIYNIPYPILMGTACTYRLLGMSLENACNEYGISLCNHHDGACDAEACALLFLKYLSGEINFQKEKEADTKAEEYIEIEKSESDSLFELPSGKHSDHVAKYYSYKPNSSNKENSYEDPFDYITDEIISKLAPLPFFQDRRFIITGDTSFDRERTYRIIKSLGGKKSSAVCKSLDYAIIGKEPGPKKIAKIEELIEDGGNIEILSESDFVSLIKSSLNTIL